MRILHVAPYAPDAWAYGGIPRLAGTLARGLAARGHAVTMCATDACDETSRLDEKVSARDDFSLRVFPNISNSLAYRHQLFAPRGLGAYLERHSRLFDVAHLHACRNLPGAIAARALQRAGVPYVLAPNGTAPRLERQFLAKRLYDVTIGHRVLRDAARVIAVSAAEERQLQSLGVDPAAIARVPNPIDLTEFAGRFPAGQFRSRYGLTNERVVMFLGKLTPRKRVDVLIRAFAQLPATTTLVVAGNDMGEGPALRSLVRHLGLHDRTIFTGLLSGRERLLALGDADVVVYPSQDEIFGLVPLEALLSGTPVIVSSDSGCGEVISHVGGGLVVSAGEVDVLANAIVHVLADPGMWHERAVAAAVRVRENYGADRVTEQLERVYEDVVRKRPTRRGSSAAPLGRGSGVSFVVPVHNGAETIEDTLASIHAQADSRPMEVIVVDDGADESSRRLYELSKRWPLRVISGNGQGAAAAVNVGVCAARFPVICQVDQDVVLTRGWMTRLLARLDDPSVGAVQGRYVTHPHAGAFARIMAIDLEQRYSAIGSGPTSHVCTGNAVYRTEALRSVGLFDESLGYGYDNDMSYRLRRAGYALELCNEAQSVHRWRDGLRGYVVQQYGFGYGRIDLVSKHPRRWTGDSVSPPLMMAHPLVLMAAIACAAAGFFTAAAALALLLIGERAVAGMPAARKFGDPIALLFPVVHTLRDVAWVAAIVSWIARRLARVRPEPLHSMTPRPPEPVPSVAHD